MTDQCLSLLAKANHLILAASTCRMLNSAIDLQDQPQYGNEISDTCTEELGSAQNMLRIIAT